MSALTTHKGFTPQTLTEAMEFSERLAKSQMVPRNYQNKPEDVLVAVQWGLEIGLAPMQALQNISVINGKPSVYGDAALALVQASPVCEDVQEYVEGEGTTNPVAVCIAIRKGRKPVTVKFSVEDARRAGLWGKQGPWTQYPKRMLQMRARGFALRDAFPDVLKGLITSEEAQDYPQTEKAGQFKDITPVNPLEAIAPPKPIEEINEDAEEEVPEIIEPVEAETLEMHDAIEVVQDLPDPMPSQDDQVTQTETPAVDGAWMLYIPNKDPIDTGTLDNWLVEYNKLADQVAHAGRAAPRTRMTKLRELREANDTTISKIPNMARVVLTQGYQTRLKHLGAIMREEEGTPDSVRADNGPKRQA
jgi:hypothetical protein